MTSPIRSTPTSSVSPVVNSKLSHLVTNNQQQPTGVAIYKQTCNAFASNPGTSYVDWYHLDNSQQCTHVFVGNAV